MKLSPIAPALTVLLLATGCAHDPGFSEGRALIEAGNVEAGLAKVAQAAKRDPSNRRYQVVYYRERDIALQRYLAAAEQARARGDWDAAGNLYRKMLALDPADSRAKAGIANLDVERRHRDMLSQAAELLQKGDFAEARNRVREVLAEDGSNREAQRLERHIEERAMLERATRPRLAAAFQKTVSLEFRDASLQQVLDVLSHRVGLKFILDRDVRPGLKTTISVSDTPLDEVLRFILATNQLKQKVLNDHTLLIYPNTQAKDREYGDTLVKSFYLANSDAKETAGMIKALVKTKDMFVDEKRNLLMIRDTPDAVRMAERLVANQDLAEPEVMLELEVMEVGTNVLKDLGIQYPDTINYSLVGAGGTPGTVTLPEWLNRSAGLVRMTVNDPFLALKLQDQIGRTNLLANPRIRVENKQHAKIHIGDRVPVITTTTTSTGFASESVNYLDVGLKLDVEPTVYLDDDVGINIKLEVSSIVRQIQSSTGTLTYQIGTRTASTVLRLHDGETQVLAGLISDEDRRNINQIPGIGDIPILGRLFGSHSDTKNKTEVVLLITPHVVRSLARPALRFEEFPGGTDASIGAPPLVLNGSK